jgi:hypothetical protein
MARDMRAKEATESAGGRRQRDEKEILVGTTKRERPEGGPEKEMLI